MNTCFGYIESMTEKPAIKAFALTVLFNLSEQYPDIRPELKAIIEERWEYERTLPSTEKLISTQDAVT